MPLFLAITEGIFRDHSTIGKGISRITHRALRIMHNRSQEAMFRVAAGHDSGPRFGTALIDEISREWSENF